MKKPERVEAGQWWRLAYSEMKEPVRLESTDVYGTMPVGVFDGGWSSASLIMSKGEYLGSGEHPEPSEWMIETLVDAMSEIENGGPAFDEPARGRFDRTNYRKIVRDAIAGKSHDLTYTRCVGVIYRLLRSLGKW